MKWQAVAPLAVFAAIAVIFATALFWGDPQKLPSALLNKPVPVFDLPPIDGEGDGLTSAMLEGEGVSVVNVWASWCVPCRTEHPVLMALKESGKARLYGINYKDAPGDARAFLAEHGNPFVASGADRDGRVAIDWGVYGVPETFVVSPQGVIVFKHVGPLRPEDLDEKIFPAIKAALGDDQEPQPVAEAD